MTLVAGRPYPLGATLRDGGVNFAVFAGNADAVDLCLFDQHGNETREPLWPSHGGIWHGFIAGAGAGLVYGYRADGRWAPEVGLRYNPHKLLLDPYAQEIVGSLHDWPDTVYAERREPADIGPRTIDTRDSAPVMLKARVAASLPPPTESMPHRSLADTVLYEVHVKGFTRLHPALPASQQGTYAGLAHPAAIKHLRRLGITAVSLLPVHYALTEPRLRTCGLTNYWGYNSIGFFAPDPRLSSTPNDPTATRHEFRAMVQALHEAGIEVILDVVFNHTAEGGDDGPTLSFRGLDNTAYYRLQTNDRRRYENYSGCGNTLNIANSRALQLVLDALRHWVGVYGVDGFRFDLAPVLGREGGDFTPQAAFFAAVEQDPLLARCKLIAEPWDIGPSGYQLGRFPGRFAEWNDRFRDTARQFWNLRSASRGEFARRLLASSDFFHHGKRRPSVSVNFVTAHDGFTLRDLVSYAHKHNEANGESNHDGHHANFSINCGVEGPSEDAGVVARRARLVRALLATTLLSQGTPMLLAGDELGHTQRGNNNAYCLDNELSWIDWTQADDALINFTKRLIALRHQWPALRRDHWLTDGERADGACDARWLAPQADAWREMTVVDWHDERCHAFGLWLSPHGCAPVLMWFNAEDSPKQCALPPGRWRLLLDTTQAASTTCMQLRTSLQLPAQSIVLLTDEATT